jgi:hypothetical protein
MDFETFLDPETSESWALRPNCQNYLEKFLGFCPTCGRVYTSRHAIDAPSVKNFMGNRCKSYWDSIDQRISYERRPKYCGHDENKGWKTLEEEMCKVKSSE